MKTETLAFKGSANAEVDYKNKVVNFSEYGEHLFNLSFDEIKNIMKKIDRSESFKIEKVQFTLRDREQHPKIFFDPEYIMHRSLTNNDKGGNVIISECYQKVLDLGAGYAQYEWIKIADAEAELQSPPPTNK